MGACRATVVGRKVGAKGRKVSCVGPAMYGRRILCASHRLCHIGEKAFLELVEQYGAAESKNYLQEIVDYTERLTRAAIAELPDGVYAFEDWLDDDGIDHGEPISLKVEFRKQGEEIVADWTGSSPQVKGASYSTYNAAVSPLG